MKQLKHASETLEKHLRNIQIKHFATHVWNICNIQINTLATYVKKTNETFKRLQHMQHRDHVLQHPYETIATYL